MESINLKEIKLILNRLIEKLEFEVGEDDIKLRSDLYRLIPTEKWSNFSDSEIDTGSLSDDVVELKKLTKNQEHPCTYVDFDRMASVLREISQIMNPI